MKNAFKTVLAAFMIMMAIVFTSSCGSKSENYHQDQDSVVVDSLDVVVDTTEVTVYEGPSTLSNAATGAVLGAGANLLLGSKPSTSSIVSSAVAGAAVGTALSSNETKSYKKKEYTYNYTIYLSNGNKLYRTGYNPYSIGDVVPQSVVRQSVK